MSYVGFMNMEQSDFWKFHHKGIDYMLNTTRVSHVTIHNELLTARVEMVDHAPMILSFNDEMEMEAFRTTIYETMFKKQRRE